jgi:hypothetical protein
MDAMSTLLAVAKLAAEIVLHYWWISVVLLAVAAAALTLGSPLRSSAFRSRARTLAVLYVIPFIIPLVGAVLRYDYSDLSTYREPPLWYGVALWAPVALYALVLLASVVFSKGARLRSTAFLAPGLWFSLCATVPAGFAIAGVGP